jgi:drug/metabolite transporter (DMT)-like permease
MLNERIIFLIKKNKPVVQALLSAVLFGMSVPFAKLFLEKVEPLPLAGFFYLGSGLGLFFYSMLFGGDNRSEKEAKITKKEIPWLVGAVVFGGIVAPVVMMVSLKNTPSSTASLLLNFEGVATAVIAAVLFKEAVGKRVWTAISLIVVASIILSWKDGAWGFSLGAVGVLTACFLWGLDNNFTRHISIKDPFTIVMIKGFVSGFFSLLLAVVLSVELPDIELMIFAMTVGFFCYGLSIVLFVFALRRLGAARTSGYFGIAPFIGTLASLFLFQESVSFLFVVVCALMFLGAFLLIQEDHNHEHVHDTVEHEHCHAHSDLHHEHHTDPDLLFVEHSHKHTHQKVTHSHEHTPDIYHRHVH